MLYCSAAPLPTQGTAQSNLSPEADCDIINFVPTSMQPSKFNAATLTFAQAAHSTPTTSQCWNALLYQVANQCSTIAIY